MSSVTKQHRRLEAGARRSEILRLATTLISERGYRGVTIEQIANACQMTKAGLLHHFASKTELLIAILAERDAADAAYVTEHVRAARSRESCRRQLDALILRNMGQREIIRLYTVLSSEALDPDHPASGYFDRRLAWSLAVIRDLAASWHPAPNDFALQCLAFMDGLQLNWLRDPSIDFEAQWRQFADRIFSPQP